MHNLIVGFWRAISLRQIKTKAHIPSVCVYTLQDRNAIISLKGFLLSERLKHAQLGKNCLKPSIGFSILEQNVRSRLFFEQLVFHIHFAALANVLLLFAYKSRKLISHT